MGLMTKEEKSQKTDSFSHGLFLLYLFHRLKFHNIFELRHGIALTLDFSQSTSTGFVFSLL